MNEQIEEAEQPTATIDQVIEQWLDDGYFDGVHRKFRNEFGDLGEADIEDAVSRVVDKMLAGPSGAIRHPRGYLVVGVRYRLRNVLRRVVPDQLPEDEDTRLAARPTQDEQIFATELLRVVKERIALWPNRKMATVTLAYVEAAYYGELVGPEELQQIVLDNLGEDVTLTNVSTLLNRGRARLMVQLAGKA
ncbi:MAG TPA: hypothetical protein VEW93_01835 [Acidimicrobiales bacterium]|nr:hypothetical protein [Acidimicrobiales bacterium]